MKKLIPLAFVFWAFLLVPAFAGQTALYFKSSPGDYIGQGKEVLLTTDQIDFYPARSYDGRSVGFWMHNFGRNSWPNYIWWNLQMSAPPSMVLDVGLYENARRNNLEDPTAPTLSFTGDGRGCNRLSGEFEVLEAVYDPDTGAVVSFAADFVQYCETWMPPLYGSIRYNSDVPLPDILLPPAITLVNALNSERCVEATGPDGATLQLTGSVATQDPVEYRWSTDTGQTGFGSAFSLDLAVDAHASVTLTVEDLNSGKQASSSLDVCVSDTTPPQVSILAPLAGSTFVGENATLTVQVADLVDKNITNYHKFVGETGDVPLDPDTGTSSTMMYRKVLGEPETVTITAQAHDFSGNVGSRTITVYQLHDYGVN